ncbi:hypothetical protein [Stenotrophomonas pavanii]|uniref:hypothetical protein n=1 Tax=Stenotrophomonas pavanii TaxID=487698 RepID=UPI0039C6753B
MIETVLGMTDLQIKLFTALGQIFVAMAVGYIAYRQWLIARDQAVTAKKKLKADLFDKRMGALSEVEDAVIEMLSDKVTHQRAIRIQRGARKFRYLFSDPAYQAANAIGQVASELAIIAPQLLGSTLDGDHRQSLVVRFRQLIDALGNDLLTLHERCAADLTLRD